MNLEETHWHLRRPISIARSATVKCKSVLEPKLNYEQNMAFGSKLNYLKLQIARTVTIKTDNMAVQTRRLYLVN
jgi:hypothetical protein